MCREALYRVLRRLKVAVLSLPHSFQEFSDDDRKLLLVGLKVLYHNLDRSVAYGYPITKAEVLVMVRKLGGKPDLI
jgi:hypothetical protein